MEQAHPFGKQARGSKGQFLIIRLAEGVAAHHASLSKGTKLPIGGVVGSQCGKGEVGRCTIFNDPKVGISSFGEGGFDIKRHTASTVVGGKDIAGTSIAIEGGKITVATRHLPHLLCGR